MPYLNRISGASARKFGLSKGSFRCLTNTSIVSLASDNRCYYPANYAATATTTNYSCQQGPGCYSGGGFWGSDGAGAGCCSCASCPWPNCAGCFSVHCTCYDTGWNPLGNVGGSCYQPYYITTTCSSTSYSCPVNSGVVSLSGTTCVYPASYNATLV